MMKLKETFFLKYLSPGLHIFAACLMFAGIFNCHFNSAKAQQSYAAEVFNEQKQLLSYPWAGGLNAVQFGAIDLNRDGVKDLLAFDRHGNRKLCFINNGIVGTISYDLQQQYAGLLPDLFEWAVFADYNGDDKTDIFTYSPGWAGMKVYKNVSDSQLKFELVADPYLKSLYGETHLNLLVTEVDYPGIADIDNDGDLDILAFWGLGSFVNFHQNMSMEKYGHADSLDYEMKDYCWGRFAESEESNLLYLDTCLNFQTRQNLPPEDERHRGSTLLLLDLNDDTVMDLLLGDIDYPGLFALMNDGSLHDAHIGSYDTLFPSENQNVSLFSSPVAAYIDVDNDNRKDLLVSHFDSRLEKSENKKSVWLYTNSGSNNHPIFTLKTRSFLQSQMIDRGSGAYPVLYDWDADGLTDLFVGNFGFFDHAYYINFSLEAEYISRIAYYKNTGTAQAPQFTLTDDDFGGLSSLLKTGLFPAFADLDGDGDTDMLAGYDAGQLILVKNQNNQFVVADTNYSAIDVGHYSTPQLFDLNKDGLFDLIIGEENGNLNYYVNQGTTENPDFVFVTDSLGKVNVTDYDLSYTGYSTPCFFRDQEDVTHLVVGSEDGLVYYFTNIDGNLNGKFKLSGGLAALLDTSNISFDRGIRTAAAIADLSNDGKFEMIAGNYSGGLEYFNGMAEVSPGITDTNLSDDAGLHIFPNPADSYVNLKFADVNQSIVLTEMIDVHGKIVSRQQNLKTTNGLYRLSLNNLNNSLYLLRVVTKNKTYTARLVKATATNQ